MATSASARELAQQAERLGDWERAAAHYHSALTAEPADPALHQGLALALMRQGQFAEAGQSLMRVVRIAPFQSDAFFQLGVCYSVQGQNSAAVAAYRSALVHDAPTAGCYYNLGFALYEQRDLAAAADAHRQALFIEPNFAKAANGLGLCVEAQGDLAEATRQYRRAVELDPNYITARLNLAGACELQGQVQQALLEYDRAVQTNPPSAKARFQYARCLQSQGQMASAIEQCEATLQLDPQSADAHFLLGMIRLAQEDFTRGWPEYEWRRQTQFAPAERPQQRWQGEMLNGARILVHAEWGLGDTLHFLRYVPLVAERGGSVVLAVQPALQPLLKTSGYGPLISVDEPVTDCEWQVPLVSLAAVFGTTWETIPAPHSYLSAEASLVEEWCLRLAAVREFRVGIAWRGAQRGSPEVRSIPLVAFAPLAQVPNVRLVSLQRHDETSQLAALAESLKILDLGDFDSARGAFMDTAAIMKNLDLVIACDSATAHVAGGLGVPVWVAIGQPGDWRWFENRDDSPWYPSLRLFRQSQPGDWAEVFSRIAGELGALVSRAAASAGRPNA